MRLDRIEEAEKWFKRAKEEFAAKNPGQWDHGAAER